MFTGGCPDSWPLGPPCEWARAAGLQSRGREGTACSVNRVALSAGASHGHHGPLGVLLPSLLCLPQDVLPGAKEAGRLAHPF